MNLYYGLRCLRPARRIAPNVDPKIQLAPPERRPKCETTNLRPQPTQGQPIEVAQLGGATPTQVPVLSAPLT